MIRRFLLSATALVPLLTVPARAEPVTLLDLLTVDRLANMGGQIVINALRGVAEVTYAHMDIRPLDGRMILTGLEVSPYEEPDCTITLDRAVITTAPLDQIAYGALDIDVLGFELGDGCLSERDRGDLAEIGITEMVLDRGQIRLEYDYASSGLTLDILADTAGLAELRAHAEFSYFAVNFDREEPVADLAYAEIEVTDQGYWSIISPEIPPMMLLPEVIVPQLVDELLPRYVDPDQAPAPAPTPEAPSDGKGDEESPAPTPQPAPLNSPEDEAAFAFIEASAATFARFAANPGTLRLEFAPEAPVRLNEDLLDEFGPFVAALSPMLFTDADRPDSRITADEAAEIQTWIDGGDVEFGDADLMRYAHAFLTGIGAPRDPGLAMELLTPLLETGNPDALDMALGTLDALDPGFAYQIARGAAAQGDRLAFAHLDRLEAAMPLLDVLELQEEDGGDLNLAGDETGRELRQMAQAALSGLGAPRRYSDAYFYALLALASGDAGAALIVDELEAMGDRMPDADATQWAETLAAIHDRANTVWFASPASE
ncbi:hypothetical protein [Nioella sp. MMSF_3534]|uniref:hypothetical protein n=1 Tax=Nioella sp. MMSF_3534 TaxID=3046720 RepID=UPI00273FE3D7|nr:hypothetical protein [Nioella sp. MMSF_3534]